MSLALACSHSFLHHTNHAAATKLLQSCGDRCIHGPLPQWCIDRSSLKDHDNAQRGQTLVLGTVTSLRREYTRGRVMGDWKILIRLSGTRSSCPSTQMKRALAAALEGRTWSCPTEYNKCVSFFTRAPQNTKSVCPMLLLPPRNTQCVSHVAPVPQNTPGMSLVPQGESPWMAAPQIPHKHSLSPPACKDSLYKAHSILHSHSPHPRGCDDTRQHRQCGANLQPQSFHQMQRLPAQARRPKSARPLLKQVATTRIHRRRLVRAAGQKGRDIFKEGCEHTAHCRAAKTRDPQKEVDVLILHRHTQTSGVVRTHPPGCDVASNRATEETPVTSLRKWEALRPVMPAPRMATRI